MGRAREWEWGGRNRMIRVPVTARERTWGRNGEGRGWVVLESSEYGRGREEMGRTEERLEVIGINKEVQAELQLLMCIMDLLKISSDKSKVKKF